MIKFLISSFLLLNLSCQSSILDSKKIYRVQLKTPAGELIKTYVLTTEKDQAQGLSGIKPDQFSDEEGALFFYRSEGEKGFWMPDTHFEIDIFYFDHSFKIIDIVRRLPFYRGKANPKLIPRARVVWSRHALEMKSSSEIAKKLQIGDKLEWIGNISPEELVKE
jgi:uncharacterized membrane protein (UPF0127 family)